MLQRSSSCGPELTLGGKDLHHVALNSPLVVIWLLVLGARRGGQHGGEGGAQCVTPVPPAAAGIFQPAGQRI